jgi:RND family efflux transporter MFP subunit
MGAHVKTIRTVLAWLSAAVVLIAGFAWLAGWFNERTEPGVESRQTVADQTRQTVLVSSEQIEGLLPVPGRLWAASRTRITSEIPGKITDIAVAAGDQVQSGDVLVKLDQTELLARADRIRAQLPAHQERVKETRAEFQRRKELLQDNAVSRERYENSRRVLVEAEATLAATEQRLVEAEGQLDESVIKAAMSGTVVDQLAKVGEVAQPGQPLLEIYKRSTLRLECAVPESVLPELRVGQEVRVELGSPSQAATAMVDEIVPQASQRSRTVLVKARLPQTEHLFEGQYGRLFVPFGQEKRVSLPAAAVQSLGQLDFVQVVTDQQRIERRFVQRGLRFASDRVQILSGVEEGESVVLPAEQSEHAASQRDETTSRR